jgi:cell fate (sporulation/competence/biofilm development) regulator YlbF (YheA/YmcA/DUF963 family)
VIKSSKNVCQGFTYQARFTPNPLKRRVQNLSHFPEEFENRLLGRTKFTVFSSPQFSYHSRATVRFGMDIRRLHVTDSGLKEVFMFPTRLVTLLFFAVALLPGTLAQAQYPPDSGEYVILSAQYGTDQNHVDVTNRLKELARSDRSFVMGNNTFGVDPDYGRVKVLRIYARGPEGRERMFEFREGSVVDGSQFRGWGRGDWGNGGWSGRWELASDNDRDRDRDEGQFVILSAQYGTNERHVDVTQRLRELARHDRTFVMGNTTFGVDPDYGRVKVLRIYARGPHGHERMFEFREGSVVDGSMFRGWGGGDWGRGGWSGRWEGGADYDRDDARGRDEGQFVILSAQYGTRRHHIDVTDRLKDIARSDRTFVMNNNTFGTDPDYGRPKALRIYAQGPDGRERMFEFRENSLVDGSQFRGWGRGDWGNERRGDRW